MIKLLGVLVLGLALLFTIPTSAQCRSGFTLGTFANLMSIGAGAIVIAHQLNTEAEAKATTEPTIPTTPTPADAKQSNSVVETAEYRLICVKYQNKSYLVLNLLGTGGGVQLFDQTGSNLLSPIRCD